MAHYGLFDPHPFKKPRVVFSPRKTTTPERMTDTGSPTTRKLFFSPTGSPDILFAANVRSPLSEVEVSFTKLVGRKRTHQGTSRPPSEKVAFPITHYFRQLKVPKGKSNLCPVESATKNVSGLLNNLSISDPSFSPLSSGPPSVLPTVENADIGLPSIGPQVLAELLQHGPKRYALHSVHIVDCRYSYEHEGGHVPGAMNITDPHVMESFLFGGEGCIDGSKSVVILYCEFSSERAPRMFKHIRNQDRKMHLAEYPKLMFPHMYVLKGGYKAFVKARPELCCPAGAYVPMMDDRFSRQFAEEYRKSSETWANVKGKRRLLTSP